VIVHKRWFCVCVWCFCCVWWSFVLLHIVSWGVGRCLLLNHLLTPFDVLFLPSSHVITRHDLSHQVVFCRIKRTIVFPPPFNRQQVCVFVSFGCLCFSTSSETFSELQMPRLLQNRPSAKGRSGRLPRALQLRVTPPIG
jgi:hypothetical protein